MGLLVSDVRQNPELPEPAKPTTARLGAWIARGVAALVGVLAFFVLPPTWHVLLRLILSWDIAVLVLVAEGWFVILSSDAEETQLRAVSEDPGRAALLAIAVGASLVSLAAALVLIGQGNVEFTGAPHWLRTVLSVTAIAGAWTLLHTAFTLHYARLYYGDPDTIGCLEFRGGAPDNADFAYFAFGIGMTFQVPDVNVTSRDMRRTVLAHQLVSFVYNTAIVALVINLIASHA